MALGHQQLRAVRSTPSPAVGSLVLGLKKAPKDERVALAAERSGADTWEGKLSRALLESTTEFERTDAASEAVSEIATLYAARERWASTALRIEALAGVLIAAWALIRGAHVTAGIALITAFAGAGVIAAIAQQAKKHEKVQRKHADDLVDLLLGPRQETSRVPFGRRKDDW